MQLDFQTVNKNVKNVNVEKYNKKHSTSDSTIFINAIIVTLNFVICKTI